MLDQTTQVNYGFYGTCSLHQCRKAAPCHAKLIVLPMRGQPLTVGAVLSCPVIKAFLHMIHIAQASATQDAYTSKGMMSESA